MVVAPATPLEPTFQGPSSPYPASITPEGPSSPYPASITAPTVPPPCTQPPSHHFSPCIALVSLLQLLLGKARTPMGWTPTFRLCVSCHTYKEAHFKYVLGECHLGAWIQPP